MVSISNSELIHQALRMRVEKEINDIIEGEAKQAAERVVRRIKERADALALDILSEYSVEDRGPHITITVRKKP